MIKLPFGMMPGHWGLAGKTREIAKAEYELEGYELDVKLLDIKRDELDHGEYTRRLADIGMKHGQLTSEERELSHAQTITDEREKKIRLAEIFHKYGRTTRYEYERTLASYIDDETQRDLALLDIEFKHGNITDTAHAKESATLKKEPWVTVINMDFSKKHSLEGSFELDWNMFFVEKLKTEGYAGATDDAIVNAWFMEVCRNIAMEEFDGTGDFTADSQANLDAVKRWGNNTETISKDRKGYK